MVAQDLRGVVPNKARKSARSHDFVDLVENVTAGQDGVLHCIKCHNHVLLERVLIRVTFFEARYLYYLLRNAIKWGSLQYFSLFDAKMHRDESYTAWKLFVLENPKARAAFLLGYCHLQPRHRRSGSHMMNVNRAWMVMMHGDDCYCRWGNFVHDNCRSKGDRCQVL